MSYKILKVGNVYKIKNLETGRIGKLKFKKRSDAQIQVNNRLKFKNKIGNNKSIV
tara:strand:- start:5055 stop:5219 length:165 start_codon:yes stop_codon:yes gene_type:complete